jgi:hypothetical protein
MHGGGDMRLVKDFLSVIKGRRPSSSTTDIMDSIHGHQIAFAADDSMVKGKLIDIKVMEECL